MGRFTTHTVVGNTQGGETIQFEAVVDPASLHSRIPLSVADQLRIASQATEEFEMDDGTWKAFPVGTAMVSLLGREGSCPVIIGPGTGCVLGMTSLAILGFILDPVTEELELVRRRGRTSLSAWSV